MESSIFALLGAAGFVAPRHIEAIHSVGGELCCACDKSDSVGVLDRRFPHCQFFLSENELESYITERKKSKAPDIDYLSVCTPNYLHFSHIAFGLSHGMNVICEKPLVLTCDDLFRLQELEKQYGKKVFCILQLRLHPQIQKLKTRVENLFAGDKQRSKLQVSLDYVTSRGPWYKKSWKFDEIKSGGVASNIGIHFFDMLIRLFGYPTSFSIKENDPERLEGMLECPLAQVEFCLSIRQKDLPLEVRNSEQRSWRQMIIDGEPFDFTNGFTDLHTKSYEEILAGRGFGLQEALPAVSLCESIRRTKG